MPYSDLFRSIGGVAGCRKLSQAFYARVLWDPLLRPFFPGKKLTCAIEEFAAFLIQFLGGPSESSQRRVRLSLQESHERFPIEEQHRVAWIKLMTQAMNDVHIKEPALSALRNFFERASTHIVGPEAVEVSLQPELAPRWESQQRLDQTVAAIRDGDAQTAIAMAEGCEPAILAGLLAFMITNRDPELLAYVEAQVRRDPSLIQQRYGGRTLLHAAAATGNPRMVGLLLDLGADPNALDGGKHTPLYSVGNQCMGSECAEVVRVLAARGANMDASDGVSGCTALHMAARRGNASTAEALLDCGAQIDAPDRRGDTPLQRALNCRKTEVAALLRSRAGQ